MPAASVRRVLAALFSIAVLTAGNNAAMSSMDLHREAVDEQSYPWSSVGKLFNGTGAACSGVVISHDAILTAAHCLYDARLGRFIPAEALHFLVGYRTGRYSTHARIASYRIGPGFEPLSYDRTSGSDWAVLTVTKSLPGKIEPLRLRRDLAPSGTRAVLVGYPQDRPFAMTADRDCELREKVDADRLLLHSCRSTFGYSGAPILVGTGGREVEVAGIQIASMRGDGTEKMIAVSAQSIRSRNRDAVREVPPAVEQPSTSEMFVQETGETRFPSPRWTHLAHGLDWRRMAIAGSAAGVMAGAIAAVVLFIYALAQALGWASAMFASSYVSAALGISIVSDDSRCGTTRPTNLKPISLPDCQATSHWRPTRPSGVIYRSNFFGILLSSHRTSFAPEAEIS